LKLAKSINPAVKGASAVTQPTPFKQYLK